MAGSEVVLEAGYGVIEILSRWENTEITQAVQLKEYRQHNANIT
jgi:hypothetical protein